VTDCFVGHMLGKRPMPASRDGERIRHGLPPVRMATVSGYQARATIAAGNLEPFGRADKFARRCLIGAAFGPADGQEPREVNGRVCSNAR